MENKNQKKINFCLELREKKYRRKENRRYFIYKSEKKKKYSF